MAIRYTPEELILLQDSPLCVKPTNLPPAEEWMGPPPDNFRNSQGSKTGPERTRHNESALLEQTNRRAGLDRHASRNSANNDEIILGPPRTMFNSATLSRGTKPFDGDKIAKEGDTRERFPFRPRNGESDTNERFRDRDRDNRSNLRRRGDGDQDSDGWNTVKSRKSFGNEGAERFHGRIGEKPDRFGGDRRPREGEDRDNITERPRRNFGEFTREKEGDDNDKLRKNGLNRNRADNPWNRESNEAQQPRERFDRSKSWRDRTDDQPDSQHERPRERQYGRWDRDRDPRQEREPEWLDEPADEPPQAHTQEEFKRFMESMKAKTTSKAEPTPTLAQDVLKPQEEADSDTAKLKPMKASHSLELGNDKFFAAFGQKTTLEVSSSDIINENASPAPKPKSGSRFQNFFSSQEQARLQPEPPAAASSVPPPVEVNPLLALAGSPKVGAQPDAAEKVAFQALLQKLQKQTRQASTPPSGGFEPPPSHDFGPKNVMASPGSFQQFGQDHREEPMARGLPLGQEIHPPQPHQNPQFMGLRPEQQMLHDLIGQRHPVQILGNRAEQPPSRNSNPNSEFLVSLMQGGRNIPEPQRNEQPVMRMPQPSRPAHIPPTPDREQDLQHERGSSQHQTNVRPAGPPSFFEEPPMHRQEREARPQPTHILQRPGQGPPGLDQIPPMNWMHPGAQSGQQLPNPGRPMIPPPGLPGSQRPGPLPGNFPSFPMGFPPPEGMAGPPRNMAPPPGFFAGPPGFMQHPGMGGFQQGPDSLQFGFDGRGMPPPGAGGPYRRN
ncbi:hypothetical protein F5B22DRAFT_635105 [Xylaria bambusicola]|uniref:uncharacterized protein n=1 Tax=Xylaria bambusicola TaxID=326684 RepID=UPI002007B056|nr:uncharacterized protein F5B22DRAFT_635105 [Xylaria bambusicola]KAI0520911.1 hypothetical protein F5B22DRAFT_635105 [Xylaria bambusicola]